MRLLASLRRLSSSASFFEADPPKHPIITFAKRDGLRFASLSSDSSFDEIFGVFVSTSDHFFTTFDHFFTTSSPLSQTMQSINHLIDSLFTINIIIEKSFSFNLWQK